MMLESEIVSKFLDEKVPMGGGPIWDAWVKACLSLPSSTPAILLQQLRTGPRQRHYAAVLVLRQWGHEARGSWEGGQYHFKVWSNSEAKGDPQTIIPVEQPGA